MNFHLMRVSSLQSKMRGKPHRFLSGDPKWLWVESSHGDFFFLYSSDFGEYGVSEDFVAGESDRLPKMPAESEDYKGSHTKTNSNFMFSDFWNPGEGVGGSPWISVSTFPRYGVLVGGRKPLSLCVEWFRPGFGLCLLAAENQVIQWCDEELSGMMCFFFPIRMSRNLLLTWWARQHTAGPFPQVTSRIITMGFPGRGSGACFRNPRKEVPFFPGRSPKLCETCWVRVAQAVI